MNKRDEMVAVVQRGVDAYAQAEIALESIKDALGDLETVYRDACKLGMMKDGAAHRMINAHGNLRGQAACIAEHVYALHEKGTAIAKANDADVAVPTGYAVPMSGGDR